MTDIIPRPLSRIAAWKLHYDRQKHPIWESWELARKKCVASTDWPPGSKDDLAMDRGSAPATPARG